MSRERDRLRFSGRRASLDAAMRDADVVVAARAASRLRVDGFPLTPDEFARARSMRRALGIALVKARMPARTVVPHAPSAPTRRRTAPLWRLVAALAVLAIALLVLFFGNEEQVGGASPPRAVPPQPVATILAISRGRTISLPLEVVVAEASPTPAPTATAAPSPDPTGGTATTANSGSGTSGTGGGGTSGNGNGTGSGGGAAPTPTPTPTPAPTATPVLPPAGFSRLNVIVYDVNTGRPLNDVCVVIGTLSCDPSAPHTDVNGRWSADVAASSASTRWDLNFIKAGYRNQPRQITLPGGVSRTYVIYLQRSR
ncbi:MAG TPA: hypothetical protein VEU77_14040 [Candidatus Acidoferrales bacterium]|nr:hypothetical protein [Candidatus Acidoferrales bacterium]